MKVFPLFLLSILCSFNFIHHGHSQTLVSIPDTETIAFTSSINQQAYRLDIALPYKYAQSDKKYPTLFVLDASKDFPLVTSIARRLQAEDDLEDFIIIGISYPDSAWYKRRKDYTPTYNSVRKTSGGGPDFLRVIQREIIPMVDAKYKTDTNNRTIGGHSLGGLFSAHLLLTGTKEFHQFIISSPSMWFDDYHELKRSPPNAIKNKAFISVGALENPHMVESSQLLAQYVKKNMPETVQLKKNLDGENHASAKFRAYADALRWIYGAKP